MADRTYTEREVFEFKMGRKLTDDQIRAINPRSRDKEGHIRNLNESDNIYKRCDICGLHFCVNAGFEDRKPRTPRFKGFVVCLDCDPRHREDRYLKEGYRVLHPRRMRVIAMALIAKNLSTKKCLSGKKKCRCVNCVASQLFPS